MWHQGMQSTGGRSAEVMFCLQDSRCYVGNDVMWWALGGNGYTSDIAKAQLYSLEAAMRQWECRESDVPWPRAYIEQLGHPAVDIQYMRLDEVAGFSGGPFFLQAGGETVGNDIVWVSNGGAGRTTNLRDALTVADADTVPGVARRGSRTTAWPSSYVNARARLVVDSQSLDRREALSLCGFEPPMPAPQRAHRAVYSCRSCGRFMSEMQFWSGACEHCGSDSRP